MSVVKKITSAKIPRKITFAKVLRKITLFNLCFSVLLFSLLWTKVIFLWTGGYTHRCRWQPSKIKMHTPVTLGGVIKSFKPRVHNFCVTFPFCLIYLRLLFFFTIFPKNDLPFPLMYHWFGCCHNNQRFIQYLFNLPKKSCLYPTNLMLKFRGIPFAKRAFFPLSTS